MQKFGILKNGEEAHLYSLKNQNGMEIKVSDFGATLVQVLIPASDGRMIDVVAGYDDVTGYEKGEASIGATVGRVANRIGGASFDIDGKTYLLTANDGKNTLHGGRDFYPKRLWKTVEADESHVTFELFSPDGDQGFPGNFTVSVTYTLTEENGVKIHYHGVSDQDTLVNMINHSYFNLAGHESGSVLSQEAWVDAKTYTRADEESIPTGEFVSVEGTPMDFRTRKAIGQDIEADYEALILGKGYDHNYVLNGSGFRKAAGMYAKETGIGMEVYTDLPGVHLYTANYLENEPGKGGVVYQIRDFLCFETQYFPDAVHKEQFEGPIVKANEAYDTTTEYRFYTE